MKFVIAKPIDGHWFYYVIRNCWVENAEDAHLFNKPKDAWVDIEILPDGDEVGAVVLPADVIVHHDVRPEDQP